MWGDSYLLLDYTEIWNAYLRSGCEGLMVVYKNYNQRVKSNVIVKNGKVVLYDKWKSYPEMIYIDNGVTVLNKVILKEIPSNRVYEVERVFKKWAEKGKLAAYETKQCFFEIGSTPGLREFEALVSQQKNTGEQK